MKPFAQLTYQGRARRLRQLAITALEQYDLNITNVSLISAWFNAIYRIDTAGGQKYVIRVCHPDNRTPDEIQAEALWLAALRRIPARLRIDPALAGTGPGRGRNVDRVARD
ncbi:MAG: hypothetical protein JXA10_04810 [Anaerolineae bacterium]|nr:hypothetical protein [Anaerolineae bacterium]